MALRVLVCGGRNYSDKTTVFDVLDRIHGGPSGPIAPLIHGAASGADALASEWADVHGVEDEAYPANWKAEGRRAGPLRNQRMIDEGKPELVVFFPGGRGTLDMIRRANLAGVPIAPGEHLPPRAPASLPAQPTAANPTAEPERKP